MNLQKIKEAVELGLAFYDDDMYVNHRPETRAKFIQALAEFEKPAEDICKIDCEFYEGCLEAFTKKKPANPFDGTIEGDFMKLCAKIEPCKPADKSSYETALKVLSMEPGRYSTIDYAEIIQQYAEAYHQRKCAECGR